MCTQSHEQICRQVSNQCKQVSNQCKQVSDQCMQVDDKRKNSNNEREREEACTQSHRELCKQVTDQCMQVDKSNKLNHNDDVKTAEMIFGNSAINSNSLPNLALEVEVWVSKLIFCTATWET